MAVGGRPRRLPKGSWEVLLANALRLIDEISRHGVSDPFWTFGGGTVLMLRYQHRRSKDIDIFVPDPQYLGYKCHQSVTATALKPGVRSRNASIASRVSGSADPMPCVLCHNAVASA